MGQTDKESYVEFDFSIWVGVVTPSASAENEGGRFGTGGDLPPEKRLAAFER